MSEQPPLSELFPSELNGDVRYRVTRVDQRDLPGEKHDGCRYFVLDITHDRRAAEITHAYFRTRPSAAKAVTAEQVREAWIEAGWQAASGGQPEMPRVGFERLHALLRHLGVAVDES